MTKTLGRLGTAAAQIGTLLSNQRTTKTAAENALRTTNQKIRAASRGIQLRSQDHVALAMDLFEKEEITSQPIASLVSVSRHEWQGAVETFLGRNRYALVVAEKRENDAVRLLRQLRVPLYDVTVVQPWHLRDLLGRKPEPGSVAELIVSDNATARAYVHRLLGRMKCVETEEELRLNDRALTKDGMLSANGGTRRLRLETPSEWILGVQLSADDKTALAQLSTKQNQEFLDATDALAATESAESTLRSCLRSVTAASYAEAVSAYVSAEREHASAKIVAKVDLPDHLRALDAQVQAAKADAETAASELRTLGADLAARNEKLQTTRGNLKTAQDRLTSFQEEHGLAVSDQDYDPELAAPKYEKATSDPSEDLLTRLGRLTNEETRAATNISTSESTARGDFRIYIDQYSVNLVEERSDWRRAAQWTKRRLATLVDSTLADYEREAAIAREAANQSFRSDVAFRMREAILRMKADISDLNRILTTCPEFTNNERYRFIAEPAQAHELIHDLIVSSAAADAGELPLEQPGPTQEKLVKLLEECETGSSTDNPLEDYRLLFKFDLVVLVNGQEVDRLSKRLGVASNGEHLVPFYVIAGACLANAYRIKGGEAHDGVALMLTDEAFHGFDEQNTFVTAGFLRVLGLQPAFAAPDSDRSKLTAVLDSVYDLYRSGADVFVEETVIKDAARALMTSDMPMQNPDLVEQMIISLEARRA